MYNYIFLHNLAGALPFHSVVSKVSIYIEVLEVKRRTRGRKLKRENTTACKTIWAMHKSPFNCFQSFDV
jgi:hypothetical protein